MEQCISLGIIAHVSLLGSELPVLDNTGVGESSQQPPGKRSRGKERSGERRMAGSLVLKVTAQRAVRF